MKSRYKLSVVIPTRNRQQYAAASVEQVLSATSMDVEVVVQDNSDEPDLGRALIRLLNTESRLTYEHITEELSFSANFDRAVSRSQGEYVCIIGDDDAVLPTLETAVEWARANGVDAITPSLNAVYYWPGSMTGDRSHFEGCLVAQVSSLRARRADPRRAAIRLLELGGVDYLSLPLVKTYHGVVRRELLDKLQSLAGHYFAGLSPDIYSSVGLSLIASEVIVTAWPLTLPGVCAVSGSADSASGRHTGELSAAPHFRGNPDYRWSDRVPAVYSVETIWAESALQAARDVGLDLPTFGDATLRRVIRHRHPSLRSQVKAPAFPLGLLAAFSVRGRHMARRVAVRARATLRKPLVVRDLPDIVNASHVLARAEGERGLTAKGMTGALDVTLSR